MESTVTLARDPQRMQALERANEVRQRRSELKRRIADGELAVATVILAPPWEARGMTVADLLISQRRWGHSRTLRFLAVIPLSETKTVASMTDRQRRQVAAKLGPC